MDTAPTRPPRNTGPIELRDFGPMGRRLGTPADCYDGSPWELHRGELVEQMGCLDIHAVAMALLAALFRTHARPGMTVMADVCCDLTDGEGASLRAPDVVIVGDLGAPKNEAYVGRPILAVEIRGTQSKRYLEEKVKLYLEHDWPVVWIAHAERHEIEVVRAGAAPVVYRPGASVPLVPELDKYGLASLPVMACFDDREAARYGDEWAQAKGEQRGKAHAVLAVLAARGVEIPDAVRARLLAADDPAVLDRLLVVALSARSAEAFAEAM